MPTAFTESELRDLLEHDSAEPPHSMVTAARVHRRVRRIRRRRLSLVAGVAAAALVVAGVNAIPRTVTAEAPDDIWAGVMAQPTPSSSPQYYYYPGQLIAHEQSSKGGVRMRYTYKNILKAVSVAVTCSDTTSYAIVWVHGMIFSNGDCGPMPVRSGLFFQGSAGYNGELEFEVLVVRRKDVAKVGKTISRADAEAIAAAAKPYRAQWGFEVTTLVPMPQTTDLTSVPGPSITPATVPS
ncbi:hypothetical protein J5X84_19040 [Streptosporangiaceae bacterium NEAU-GS5]|nr:hypothetical protein [Streptosporangiaceae bacterium NEAU-GS5]